MYGPDAQLPTSLRRKARWERLGSVPVMIVQPPGGPHFPGVLWMHGRTVSKELDPGRYLRWMRAGIGACAVDLPGHGERYDETLLEPDRTLDVVVQMLGEIDGIVEALPAFGFDPARLGIGGVSAGGMAALVRLCDEHEFTCTSVEATSGSWQHQSHRPMFVGREEEARHYDPMQHLDTWREIPFQALHAIHDEWMGIEGQRAFVEALKARYADPSTVELVEFGRTGAPHEHVGFGRQAAVAKNRQAEFFAQWLCGEAATR